MTRTAILETFFRINLYAHQYGTVPPSLEILPKREGYANRIADGWNQPLQYTIHEDGIITLTSLGRDREPGGDGDDADISRSYYTRRKDGTLWVGQDLWIAEAEARQ